MEENYLIKGLKNKDIIVFDFVFNYYYSGLCAYANRWLKNQEMAEDIVQDFFVRLWIDSSKMDINTSLKSYFFSSIKNCVINKLKHIEVEKKYGDRILYQNDDHAESDSWEITESELMELIEKGMKKLPPRCREIFIMSRIEGKTNGNIAELLGISKRTVELQISNALKVMRSELKDYVPSLLLFWLLK